MSPRSVVREAVHGDGGDAHVTRQGDRVSVEWTCGGGRSFTPDDLRAAVHYVDTLAAGRGVSVLLKDSDRAGFSVLVRDGKLYSSDGPTVEAGADGIPWDHLKAAITDALSAQEKRAERAAG